jgi:hypothetical protein
MNLCDEAEGEWKEALLLLSSHSQAHFRGDSLRPRVSLLHPFSLILLDRLMALQLARGYNELLFS